MPSSQVRFQFWKFLLQMICQRVLNALKALVLIYKVVYKPINFLVLVVLGNVLGQNYCPSRFRILAYTSYPAFPRSSYATSATQIGVRII